MSLSKPVLMKTQLRINYNT